MKIKMGLILMLGLVSVVHSQTKEDLAAGVHGLVPDLFKNPFSVDAYQEGWEQADLNKGIKNIDWNPDMIMRIVTRDFMSTTIKLPTWETVVHYEVGETENFITKKIATNILTLRAIHAGCDTNLTVVGKTGNLYSFYVRSLSFKDKKLPDLAVYVKTDSGKNNQDIRKLTRDDREFLESKDDIPFDPSTLNFDYFMSGHAEIAPQTIYSDGIFTWLDYGVRWNKEDMPVVFQIKDEVESPVNTRVEGTKIIIESVGDFVLKSGAKRLCIFSEDSSRANK